MIVNMLAAAQELRTRPPRLLDLALGLAAAGLGLTMLQRYNRHQAARIAQASDELDRLHAERTTRLDELEAIGVGIERDGQRLKTTRENLAQALHELATAREQQAPKTGRPPAYPATQEA